MTPHLNITGDVGNRQQTAVWISTQVIGLGFRQQPGEPALPVYAIDNRRGMRGIVLMEAALVAIGMLQVFFHHKRASLLVSAVIGGT